MKLVLDSVAIRTRLPMRRFIELKNKADADLRHTERALLSGRRKVVH